MSALQALPSFADRDQLLAFALEAVPRVLAALLVVAAFWAALNVTRPALRAILARARLPAELIALIVNGLYKGALVILGAVMAVSQLGVNVTAALAGVGVLGIAVGFAAQETISNLIAGFLIFWDRPFQVGDYLTSQDKYGRVQEITMRTTRIRTMENTYVVIPNRQIIGDLLVNHSMYGETRVNVPVGIAYKESISEARRVLLDAARTVHSVLAVPPPEVVAMGLGDSSVDLQVRVWIENAAMERRVFHEVLEAAKAALDAAGIEIPFPHLQLFVEDVRDRVWDGAARARNGAPRAG